MDLEARFNVAMAGWLKHCSTPKVGLSSSSTEVLDSAYYKKVVSLGVQVLPYIRKAYDVRINTFPVEIVKSHLVCAVQQIIGEDFRIPKSLQGNIKGMERYTKSWLDEHMKEYLQEK